MLDLQGLAAPTTTEAPADAPRRLVSKVRSRNGFSAVGAVLSHLFLSMGGCYFNLPVQAAG